MGPFTFLHCQHRQEDEKNEEADQSESDDSTSKKSSVAGKDFELVDKNDTDAWENSLLDNAPN